MAGDIYVTLRRMSEARKLGRKKIGDSKSTKNFDSRYHLCRRMLKKENISPSCILKTHVNPHCIHKTQIHPKIYQIFNNSKFLIFNFLFINETQLFPIEI